ncbi:hypothetical protein DMENIID0001_139860 [Sergentomyia squamirostris]
MDLREKSLQEALHRNAEETARWTAFRNEQGQAMENLQMYRKQLEVEIMVPIGNKALLPGHLYHTNEVMVTHFNGLFTKCTVDKAVEILETRLGNAHERLSALESERDLFENRLELPGMFDALAGREIIEEYDEEKEREWRYAHRDRVREQKQKEAKERKVDDSEFDDMMARLDELELIEELNDDEESPQEEVPRSEVLQVKRKSLTFSEKDSVQLIESHEAPCKAAARPQSLNPDLTLHLEVDHSPSLFTPSRVENEITSPADIYRLFSHCLNPGESQQPKSILKNREAVEKEIHLPQEQVLVKGENREKLREIISVDHSSILGEIKERNPNIPAQSNVKASTSKRPVSRFKSSREHSS